MIFFLLLVPISFFFHLCFLRSSFCSRVIKQQTKEKKQSCDLLKWTTNEREERTGKVTNAFSNIYIFLSSSLLLLFFLLVFFFLFPSKSPPCLPPGLSLRIPSPRLRGRSGLSNARKEISRDVAQRDDGLDPPRGRIHNKDAPHARARRRAAVGGRARGEALNDGPERVCGGADVDPGRARRRDGGGASGRVFVIARGRRRRRGRRSRRRQ